MAACVQTQQYADVQFTPPSGDYKLPRASATTSRLARLPPANGRTSRRLDRPRADNIIAALRAQQGLRGGQVTIIERRNSFGRRREGAGRNERLMRRSTSRIVIHKYLGDYCPPSAAGPRLVARKRRHQPRAENRHDMHVLAEDSGRLTGRIALGGGIAGASVVFCAPQYRRRRPA